MHTSRAAVTTLALAVLFLAACGTSAGKPTGARSSSSPKQVESTSRPPSTTTAANSARLDTRFPNFDPCSELLPDGEVANVVGTNQWDTVSHGDEANTYVDCTYKSKDGDRNIFEFVVTVATPQGFHDVQKEYPAGLQKPIGGLRAGSAASDHDVYRAYANVTFSGRKLDAELYLMRCTAANEQRLCLRPGDEHDMVARLLPAARALNSVL